MTSENKTWESSKAEYLRQVEKALSSVKHPSKKEVLEDVCSHLDRRFAELKSDEQSWENFQAIITEMGPASDYAELLESDATTPAGGTWQKYVWWVTLTASVIVIAIVLLTLAIFPKISEADRIDAEGLSSKGWQLWQERKLVEAEDIFKQAIQKDKANANAWNGLGWSQFNQGKPLNAMVSFEKCLKIQPEHPAALNGLGWIAKEQGKVNEAIDYWNKAVAAAPGTTAALHGLATTYMEMEQYDKAVYVYQRWLAVEPNNAQVKADLKRAKSRKPVVELSDLPGLITELSDPNAPRFQALNRIIKLGSAAVPTLIKEMKTSDNWQIPKALGAIADQRAVLPLIEKLEKSDHPPMPQVIGEALERITGQKFGTSKEQWRKWWEEHQQEK